MKNDFIAKEIENVLAAIPTDQQIIIALRYGNRPEELKTHFRQIRSLLEELKTKITKEKK